MSLPHWNNETSSRDRILDAAETLFAKRGYAGVGLREVAEVVGLGKSSLFHHFKNKPQLYAAVCGRILRRIEESLMRTLAAGGTPVERLERWLDDLVNLLVDNPSYARVLLRSLFERLRLVRVFFEDDDRAGEMPEEIEVERAIASIMGSAGALLREGMGSGAFRAANVPHMLLSLVGITVFPFASGEFGQEILGKDVFDPAEVERRKHELREFLRFGLIARSEA